MNQTVEQSKNRTVAFWLTTFLYSLLLLFFWYIKIWDLPKIELPTEGIELANIGNSDKGSGDIQTSNKPSEIKSKVESKPSREEKVIKPKINTPTPKISKPVKTKEVPIRTSNAESPVQIKVEPPRKVTIPAKQPVTKPEPPKKIEEPKPIEQPKVDNRGLYGKGNTNGTKGNSDEPGGNNNGPEGNKGVGDYGSPDGKPDGRGLYGKGVGGGGGGASLDFKGWTWTSRPNPQGLTSESGRVAFQVTVDEDGHVTNVKILENTLSPSDARICKTAIERLTFIPKDPSGERPSTSTGRIVFTVRSQ